MFIPYQAQLAHGWTSLAIRINIVAVLTLVPAIFWATSRYGAEGAAWAWVSLNAGYVLIGIQFMYHKILQTEKWNWYKNDLIWPLGAAVISALIVDNLISIDQLSAFFQMVSMGVASGGVLLMAGMAAPILRKKIIARISQWLNLLRVKTP